MKAPLLTLFAVLAIPASAQTPDIQALMSLSSLRCTFPWVAQTDWVADTPSPIVKKQEFGFEITAIEFSRNSARIVGQLGSTELAVSKGIDVLNFVERSPFGVLNLTSVFSSRDKMGRFKAVHSRHLSGGLVAAPFPSQNYGYCEAQ